MSEIPPGESPYPRSTTSAMAPRPPGVYFDCLSDGIQLVKQDVGMWMLAALLTLALSYGATLLTGAVASIVAYGSMTPAAINPMGFVLQLVLSFFSSALTYCFLCGMMQMALARVDGRPLDVSAVFTAVVRYPQMLVAVSVMTIAIYVGLILVIIPGLFVAGALAFAPMLVVRRGMSGMDALRLSWDTLKPHAFGMFGFQFVCGLVAVIGVLACGVGILFTFPVYVAAMALQYRIFFPDEGEMQTQTIGMEPPKPQW